MSLERGSAGRMALDIVHLAGTAVVTVYGGPFAGLAVHAAYTGVMAAYDTTTGDDILNKQQSLADLHLQTSTLGKTIPQVTGKGQLAPNVIWASNKIEHQERESESAGKGGGPQQVTITKTYTISYAMAICDTLITGPMAGISKAWRDTTLVYDRAQQASLPEGWAFYSGAADQPIDPVIESYLGTADTTAYRHTCYVRIAHDNLGRSARTYNYRFEVYQDVEGSTALATIAISPTTGDVWAVVPSLLQAWRIDETSKELTGAVALTDGSYPPPGAIMAPISIDASGVPWCASISGDLALHHVFVLDPTGLTVDQTIDVTHRPASNIVFSDGDAWIVVSDETIATPVSYVKRLDPGGTVVATIAVNYATYPRLAVGLDGNVWATSASGTYIGTAQRIDPASNTVVATVAIGDWANDVYVSSGGFVWVPTYDSPTVKRINPATNLVTHTITVAARPWRIMEASDGFLWVACRSGAVSRINVTTNTAVSYTVPGIVGPEEIPAAFSQLLAPATSGTMWVIQTAENRATRVTTTGTQLSVRVGADPRDIRPGASNTVWVASRGSGELVNITDGGAVTGLSTANTLTNVLERYANAAGIPSGNLDFTDAPYALVNVMLLNVQAVKTIFEMLMQAYRFYIIESGTRLKFRERGSGSSVFDIPEDDVGAGEEEADEIGVDIVRGQHLDLPTKLDYNYIDPERNYDSNTQRGTMALQDGQEENARVISTPLVLSASQAKQVAQEVVNELWIQREVLATKVTRAYAHLEPGDRGIIRDRGIAYACVLCETTYGKPGLMELKARPDAFAVVGALGAVPGVVPVTPQTIGDVGSTEAFLLNLPALNSSDQVPRYHVAYIGETEPWEGGALYRSADAEASFQLQDAGVLEAMTGTVALATADADYHFLDTTTVITVVMEYSAPVSVSDLALYNGANLFFLGDEIIGGAVWALTATDTYQVTRLLRGRRGTEFATSTHAINERLVVLDAAVRPVSMTLADDNVSRPFKAVTNGQSLADVTSSPFMPTARNLDPWTVAQPNAALDGTDWVLTWGMRSRFSGDWVDGSGIGFDPDFVGFIVDIWSDNTYTVLKRSTLVDGGNPLDPEALKTWTYLEADQITDFGSAQLVIYYQVYQVTNNGLSTPVENLVGA